MKSRSRRFFIRLYNWEYWPVSIANIPVVLCWLYYGLRARDLFFFSAVNPVIETGGVFGESKINILQRIPRAYLPTTVFVKNTKSLSSVLKELESRHLEYPLIAKPDIGERGFRVERIQDEAALRAYMLRSEYPFLIQDFVTYPMELSVLYHRFPGKSRGTITSLCIKETLKVRGDGESSIEQLMHENDRAYLQLARFRKKYPQLLSVIPAPGELVELEPIGNHSRGTMFLNGNDQIDKRLTAVFDEIHREMEDMWYGRFDLKCQSIAALREGRNFRILEFNGIASEPAHIYDPGYPLLRKYRDIFRHWRIIYELGKVQRERGVPSMTLREALTQLRAYFRYLKAAGI